MPESCKDIKIDLPELRLPPELAKTMEQLAANRAAMADLQWRIAQMAADVDHLLSRSKTDLPSQGGDAGA